MTIQNIFLIQAFYYFFSSLWPLIHMQSFEKITGQKTDKWLVYTVALLLLCSSMVFFYSSSRSESNNFNETLILSVSNCIALITIDVAFVVKKIIRKIYLADAVLEIGLLALIAKTI